MVEEESGEEETAKEDEKWKKGNNNKDTRKCYGCSRMLVESSYTVK